MRLVGATPAPGGGAHAHDPGRRVWPSGYASGSTQRFDIRRLRDGDRNPVVELVAALSQLPAQRRRLHASRGLQGWRTEHSEVVWANVDAFVRFCSWDWVEYISHRCSSPVSSIRGFRHLTPPRRLTRCAKCLWQADRIASYLHLSLNTVRSHVQRFTYKRFH